MSDGLPPNVKAALALALVGGLGWGGLRWYDARQTTQREEAARVAAEIEAERAAQVRAAREAQEAREAEEAAARAKAEAEARAAERQARRDAEAALGDVRDVDRLLLLDWVGRDLGASKRRDVTRGRPYRVDVYQDDGKLEATEARVDLDRDERWDERWFFEGAKVRRERSPKDDETYTVFEVWDGARFKREGS